MNLFTSLVYFAITVTTLLAADDVTTCSKDQWQCASGGSCIWETERCNGKLDCPDGSDETPACVRPGGVCKLPPHPDHGSYRADVDGKPGATHPYFTVNVTCDVGYKLIGEGSVRCLSGWWQTLIPSCVYAGECGLIQANSTEQKASKRTQMPWHVDFYDKVLNYKHICAGTLIRDDAVISLAYCFLNTYPTPQPIPVEDTVALAGNRNRDWNSPDESPFAQRSGVKQIYLANYNSSGAAADDETVKIDDVALVILSKPFEYNAFIRPVCVNFDLNFDRLQLQPGSKGKFPAWGFSPSKADSYAPTFDVVDFSFVDSDRCILETRELLRRNNFVLKPEQTVCTEYKDGDVFQCVKGYDDTGTGLVYPQPEPDGNQRYYLRGILWRFANLVVTPDVCTKVDGFALFTRLQNYEEFIKKYFKQPDSVVDERLESKKCILPPYPAKGRYTPSVANARPGDTFDVVSVNITCQEGFIPNGPAVVVCSGGVWSPLQLPQCVPQCRLIPQKSVEYRCVVSLEVQDGFRACNEFEPSDTLVSPVCRTHYYSATALKFMHCIDGEWFNIPKCIPECGTLTPNGTQLVIGGRLAQAGEVPWHAGIYSKATRPYKQICGGSLISNKLVISAAHCFWGDSLVGKMPASNFAVAVGKLYRFWDNKEDPAQRFDVKELHIPVRFQGSDANFQEDIAILVLNATVRYETYIRPVCIDFDVQFENRQLQPGNKGKVAGWGLAAEDDTKGSQELRVVDLPYVPVLTCIDGSPESFRAHITSDKICAGYKNAHTALCKGDSGGGLAFPELDRGTQRYYLRGVASTAPTNENLCNADTYTTFTRIITHEQLITRFWGD